MTAPLEVPMPEAAPPAGAQKPGGKGKGNIMGKVGALLDALRTATPEDRALALGELATGVQQIIQETYSQMGGPEAGMPPPEMGGMPPEGMAGGPPMAVPSGAPPGAAGARPLI